MTHSADDPADLVVAYCAPGLKNYATRLLEVNGESVREVIEHAYMAGHTDIILATDTGDGWLPPALAEDGHHAGEGWTP